MQKNTRINRGTPLPDGVSFLTLKECASYLRVNYFTFYRWVQNADGPPTVQLSDRCIRVPKDGFLAWIEKQKPEPVLVRSK